MISEDIESSSKAASSQVVIQTAGFCRCCQSIRQRFCGPAAQSIVPVPVGGANFVPDCGQSFLRVFDRHFGQLFTLGQLGKFGPIGVDGGGDFARSSVWFSGRNIG